MERLETPTAHQIVCGDCESALIVGRPAGRCELCGEVVCTWCAAKHRCACSCCGEYDADTFCPWCEAVLCKDCVCECVSDPDPSADDDEWDEIDDLRQAWFRCDLYWLQRERCGDEER